MSKIPKPLSVASFINYCLLLCGKKQLEIAEEVGFNKPNIITMIKQGKTPLPKDKILRFARALGVDPLLLAKKVYSEYSPVEWEMLEQMLGQPILTADELAVVAILREEMPVEKAWSAAEQERLRGFVRSIAAG